jgi:imidazolonepropionase-like amidohydrolase
VAGSAIIGALLIDGSGAEPLPETTVLWQGDRITWVGPDAEADTAGADVIEAGGRALLPGLIDSHVHMSLDATLQGVEAITEEPLSEVRHRTERNATRFLGSGITTVRDLASRDSVAIEVAAAQRSGSKAAPYILAAGRALTPTGGHGWQVAAIADGPDEVRAAVRAEIERGADVIKLIPTGGVLGTGAHGFDVTMGVDEVAAGIDEAHAAGLLVAAHIHGPEGVAIAIAAGIDTIEHGTALTPDQAATMAQQGIALVPTMTAIDMLFDHADELGEELMARLEEVRSVAADGVRGAIAAHTSILAGTDSGTPFNPPGLLAHEIEALHRLGLGQLDAIAAATSAPARVLGLSDRGIVETGKRSDLILVGDPLADLLALGAPDLIVQGGELRKA